LTFAVERRRRRLACIQLPVEILDVAEQASDGPAFALWVWTIAGRMRRSRAKSLKTTSTSRGVSSRLKSSITSGTTPASAAK
jgi:hypothetical protein